MWLMQWSEEDNVSFDVDGFTIEGNPYLGVRHHVLGSEGNSQDRKPGVCGSEPDKSISRSLVGIC